MQWNEYRPGDFSVLAVFGTSNVERADRGTNFVVSKYLALQKAGLCKETLFDLGRSRWLPWTTRWFTSPDPHKWPTPIIGHIESDGAHVLRYILQQRAELGLRNPPKAANTDQA